MCRFYRLLAFSESPITAVHVNVDGVSLGKASSAGGPLYVLQWNPTLYATGLHTIRVNVEVGNDLNKSFCSCIKHHLSLVPQIMWFI